MKHLIIFLSMPLFLLPLSSLSADCDEDFKREYRYDLDRLKELEEDRRYYYEQYNKAQKEYEAASVFSLSPTFQDMARGDRDRYAVQVEDYKRQFLRAQDKYTSLQEEMKRNYAQKCSSSER